MSTAEQGTICTRNIKTQFLSLRDTASFSSGTLHAVLKSTANVQTCSCKTVKCSTDRRVTGQCGRSSVQSLLCQQAVPRLKTLCCRPLTAEAQVRDRVKPCGICNGQSGNGTGFSPSSTAFPCQYHSTVVLHTHHLGMDNRPFGGRSSDIYFHPIDTNRVHRQFLMLPDDTLIVWLVYDAEVV
jgi:hypothetical protein